MEETELAEFTSSSGNGSISDGLEQFCGKGWEDKTEKLEACHLQKNP